MKNKDTSRGDKKLVGNKEKQQVNYSGNAFTRTTKRYINLIKTILLIINRHANSDLDPNKVVFKS